MLFLRKENQVFSLQKCLFKCWKVVDLLTQLSEMSTWKITLMTQQRKYTCCLIKKNKLWQSSHFSSFWRKGWKCNQNGNEILPLMLALTVSPEKIIKCQTGMTPSFLCHPWLSVECWPRRFGSLCIPRMLMFSRSQRGDQWRRRRTRRRREELVSCKSRHMSGSQKTRRFPSSSERRWDEERERRLPTHVSLIFC